MTKIKRPVIENGIYFISNSTFKKEELLLNPAFASIVVEQIKHYEIKLRYRLHAYVVMPDHYHMLIQKQELSLHTPHPNPCPTDGRRALPQGRGNAQNVPLPRWEGEGEGG